MNEGNIGTLYYDIGVDTQPMLNAERQAKRSLDAIGREAERAQHRLTGVAQAVAAAVSALALGGLVAKVVTAQRQFDVMNASLKTVTGSAELAGDAFERLRQFAATTPYSVEQAVGAFIKLKTLGLDPSERALTSFGNTAAAMGKDLNQMIEAVADASTGEFERLKEFGIKAKNEGDRVTFTFQGVATTVRNNANDITEYLTKIGEVNFAGAMSQRMKTLDGDISNLRDSLDALFLAASQSGFGDAIAAGVRAATEAIQEATKSVEQGGLTSYFDKLRPLVLAGEVAIASLAGVIASKLVASAIAAGWRIAAMATATTTATVAARGFTAALTLMGGPLGIIVTGLALLAMNWDKVSGASKTAAEVSENSAARIAAALAKSKGAAAEDLKTQLAQAQATLGKLDGEIKAGSVRSIYGDRAPVYGEKRLAELKAQRDEVAGVVAEIESALAGVSGTNYGNEGRNSKAPPAAPPPPPPAKRKGETEAEIRARQDLARMARQDAAEQAADAEARAKAEKDAADARKREEERRRAQTFAQDIAVAGDPVAQLVLESERKQEALIAARDQELLTEREYAAAKIALQTQTSRQLTEIEEEERNKRVAAQQQMLTGIGEVFGGLADLQKAFAGEQDSVYRALFAAQKAFAIASALVSIQAGAAKAYELGWPLGLVAGAQVLAQGAGLISTIKSASYGGGRQYGGPTSAGTLYRVNETGQPEMFTAANGAQYMLPTQDGSVTPASQVGGGGNVVHLTQNFYMNGDAFSRADTIALIQRGGEATQAAVLQTLERTRR